MRRASPAFLVVILAVGAAVAQDTTIPPPPEWLTPTFRTTLSHGLQLMANGDFAFADGHFVGIKPPKPARVYVNVSCAPQPLRRRCDQAALEAMSVWGKASPDLVEFVPTDDEDLADIVLQFEPSVAVLQDRGAKFVCGVTSVQMPHDGQGVDRSALVRVSVSQAGAGTHSTAEMVHVVGHELGHFLGLGESPNKADIMGEDDHKAAPSTTVTADDLARFQELLALGEAMSALAQRKEKVAVPRAWQPPKAAAAPSEPSQTSPKPGEKALDFTMKDLDGKEVTLSALQGKPVLLDFWATWCGPCKADLPNFKKIVETYGPKGLIVVGVSLDDDEAKLRRFVADEHIAWPQLFDGKGWQNAIAVQYGVHSIPQSLLIGPDGMVVRRENQAGTFEEDIARLVGGR
ncbi:MAG: redoxin domain-containing protein [Armatimonadetes bacterium]|nr:redoxin domain-containing protein [Armatimonadota bacterium]